MEMKNTAMINHTKQICKLLDSNDKDNHKFYLWMNKAQLMEDGCGE